MVTLAEWKYALITATIARNAEQIKQFDLVPTLAVDRLDADLQTELVRCHVWAVQKPARILKAINTRTQFSILVGLRPSRLHIGHLSLAREVAMWMSLGGAPTIVVFTVDTTSHSEIDRTVLVLKKCIETFVGRSLGLVPTIVDIEDPHMADLERRISGRVKLRKLKQLYGWEDDITLLQLRSSAMMAASFLLPSVINPGLPCVALVDEHQLPHAEVTRIVAPELGVEMPCFSYRILLQALNGPLGRMSSKEPSSVAYLDQSSAELAKLLNRSFSGGKPSAAEQRQLGGRPDLCSFFHAAEMLLRTEEMNDMAETCSRGIRLCGECKATFVTPALRSIGNCTV